MKNFCEDLFFFFFFGDRLKNFSEDLFFFFFGEHLRFVSLVLGLGLEHSCPWPRECLSSERLSLALASDFFCVLGLGLEPCVLDSTSAYYPIDDQSRKQEQLLFAPPRSRLPRGVVNPRNKKTRKNILRATYVLSNLGIPPIMNKTLELDIKFEI